MIVIVLSIVFLWLIASFYTAKYDFVNCYKYNECHDYSERPTTFCSKDDTRFFIDCPLLLIWFAHFIAGWFCIPVLMILNILINISNKIEKEIKKGLDK
jgi:hypothetical protein